MTNIIATTKAAGPDGTMSAELYRELQRMGRTSSSRVNRVLMIGLVASYQRSTSAKHVKLL